MTTTISKDWKSFGTGPYPDTVKELAEFFDTQIAPMLGELRDKGKELGFRVEIDTLSNGKFEITLRYPLA